MKKIFLLFSAQVIRCNGNKWRINKNDVDPFPSNPHAHNVDKPEKLNLYNGEVFNITNKMYLRTLSDKVMKCIYSKIMNNGQPEVKTKLEQNIARITYVV